MSDFDSLWSEMTAPRGNSGGGSDFESLFSEMTQPSKTQQWITAGGGSTNDEPGLLDPYTDAAQRGWNRFQQGAAYLMGDAEGVAEQQKDLDALGHSEAISQLQKKVQESEGWGGAALEFAKNPGATVELTIESLAQFAPTIFASIGAGAAGGSVAGPLGSAAGAAGGTALGSFATEYTSTVLDGGRVAGYDLSKPEQVEEFFADEELMGTLREKATKRGIPIAAFDALSMGIAGRVYKPVANALTGAARRTAIEAGEAGYSVGAKAAGAGAEIFAQGALGGAGEAAGSYNAGQEIERFDVLAEAFGELLPGAVESMAGSALYGKKPGADDPNDPQIEEPLDEQATVDRISSAIRSPLHDATDQAVESARVAAREAGGDALAQEAAASAALGDTLRQAPSREETDSLAARLAGPVFEENNLRLQREEQQRVQLQELENDNEPEITWRPRPQGWSSDELSNLALEERAKMESAKGGGRLLLPSPSSIQIPPTGPEQRPQRATPRVQRNDALEGEFPHGPAPYATGNTPTAVRMRLANSSFGKQGNLKKLEAAGALQVVESEDQLPPEIQAAAKSTGDAGIQGVVYKGKIYLVANQIDPGKEYSVLIHEGKHYSLERPESSALHREVNRQFLGLLKQRDKHAMNAVERIRQAGETGPAAQNEAVAYLVEEVLGDPQAASQEAKGLVAKIVRDVRIWFSQTKLGKVLYTHGVGVQLTPQDIVEIVRRGMIKTAEADAGSPASGAAFSRKGSFSPDGKEWTDPKGAKHSVTVRAPSDGKYGAVNFGTWLGKSIVDSGTLLWEEKSDGRNVVVDVRVNSRFPRRGVATAMWDKAVEISPNLEHAKPEAQTDAGKLWAASLESRRKKDIAFSRRKASTPTETKRETEKHAAADIVSAPPTAEARLRKALKRKPGVGAPSMKAAKRFVLPNKSVFFLGPVTTPQWVERVESTMSDAEIKKARKWYSEIDSAFSFIKDVDERHRIVVGWLAANKNESPQGALRNALRVREQVLSGASGAKGGLSDAALRQLYRDGKITDPKGIGAKLFDFVDSYLGHSTRTVMGNDPKGGEPAVVDVHTGRDVGYLDPVLLRFAEKNFGKKAIAGLESDVAEDEKGGASAVSEPQYEWGAERLRQITRDLNKRGWQGGELIPAEVQAIGWMAITAQMRQGQSANSEESIRQNTRTLAWEAVPGTASPYGDKVENTLELTKKVAPVILHAIREFSGVYEIQSSFAVGGWGDAISPNVLTSLLSSEEGSQLAADVLGYLLMQDAVLIVHNKPGGKDAVVTAVDTSGKLKDLATLRKVWDRVRKGYPSAVGFSPAKRGEHDGFSIVFTKKEGQSTDALLKELEADLAPILETISEDLDLQLEVTTNKIAAEFRDNNWKVDTNGESYLARISERLGDARTRELVDHYRSRIEPLYAEAAGVKSASADEPRFSRAATRRVGSARADLGVSESTPRYGEPREGSVEAIGIHFSGEARESLDSRKYGAGLKGAEAQRLRWAPDARLKSRTYFYIAEGTSIVPEQGTGQHAHRVVLRNLYDLKADPLGLRKANSMDPNAMESAILDAGFDGYVVPGAFVSRQDESQFGVAVLMGERTIPVEQVGSRNEPQFSRRKKPLSEITFTETVYVEGRGEVEITRSAEVLARQLDKKINTARDLLRCVS